MSDAIHDFTLAPLDWRPHVRPLDMATASPGELAAIGITSNSAKASDYVRVLAQDAPLLAERTPLFNDIMYSEGGLSRGARELGALGASVVNHCVYCAFVHANRFNALEKRPEVVETIFRDGIDADLPAPDQAIFDFAVELTAHADKLATTGVYHLYHLREIGLSELQILDLIHAVAIFGWANRLMHTLGEPHLKG